MKVLLLDLGHELRGGQRQVLYLASYLTHDAALEREFQPVLLCPESSPLCRAALDQGISVFPLKGRRFWNPFVILQVRRIMALMRDDGGARLLIHSQDAHSASLGAMLAGGDANSLLMHTRRVSYPLHRKGRASKYVKADAVAAVSAEIAETLAAGGVTREKIRVIHSGIEVSSYAPKNAAPHGVLRFIVMGALTEQKGHEILLRAMSLLKKSPDMPDYEVWAAGQGPLLESLTVLAANLGVADKIKFLGQREGREILPDCDILLSPSSGGEGSNAAIKEGWAVGLPVIASDLPSNLELVEPEKSGLAFAAGNAQALAAAMLRLAGDAALRERLVQGGKERLPAFTSAHMAQSYVNWYRVLAGGAV